MKTEINSRGNSVQRDHAEADRYLYDFGLCSAEKGWTQYDTTQDAHYFGIWVHTTRRIIFTYCEGDLILVTCPTEESYKAELAHMAEFYGPAPAAFTVINSQTGTITKVYDERPV